MKDGAKYVELIVEVNPFWDDLSLTKKQLSQKPPISEKWRTKWTWLTDSAGEQALPALAKALRSERIAVKATEMNPRLLRVSEALPKLFKLVPKQTGMGSE